MQLKESLFQICSSRTCEAGYGFTIRLNPDHIIFKAHFPGYPVTPGVVLMQIAQELCSVALSEKLTLHSAKNVKFLRVVKPAEDTDIEIDITNVQRDNTMVSAHIEMKGNDETVAKFSMTFRTNDE